MHRISPTPEDQCNIKHSSTTSLLNKMAPTESCCTKSLCIQPGRLVDKQHCCTLCHGYMHGCACREGNGGYYYRGSAHPSALAARRRLSTRIRLATRRIPFIRLNSSFRQCLNLLSISILITVVVFDSV
jgi:hypothetical protein